MQALLMIVAAGLFVAALAMVIGCWPVLLMMSGLGLIAFAARLS